MCCWKGVDCTRGKQVNEILLITVCNRLVGAHCCKVGNSSKTTALSTTGRRLPSRLASGRELHHSGSLTRLAKDSKSCPCPLNCYSHSCLQLFKTLRIYTTDHNDFSQGIASCGHADTSSAKTAINLNRHFTGNVPGLLKPHTSVRAKGVSTLRIRP